MLNTTNMTKAYQARASATHASSPLQVRPGHASLPLQKRKANTLFNTNDNIDSASIVQGKR